ncbi:amino acid/amide ABC transporter ATP-binding protein 1, HAAT family [Desulfonispora thiosulfatigenes DSM 11270]|uniref:Amino acid/amide ABC transporter ATP-binding protein 1, HAAT family n=1 Tax=Desulfonispora thiosulfatigenes DSM 11270 TaxID=656914 RepID=A0A1W1VE59_DESTI|nr:ABC transporter ATP-binding protein [Desulfonispora thiosulfatigenes]SMB91689.1 amino acid/amide ABC transporter ATP-binding protein 1, HAAT family [Desulfonispora thiosulfatigenes DSM 11270]
MELLKTTNLTMQFGGLVAVNKVSFNLNRAENIGIIGPNGSGKTTFFNLLTGIYEPTGGDIIFEGKKINGSRPDYNYNLGIARTFQNGRLFWKLNVLENVMMGLHTKQKSFLWDAVFRTKKERQEEKEAVESAREILGFFSKKLLEQQDKLASDLSYADRRRLEICRALVSKPKLLILDEPSAGMDPNETLELVEDIKKIRKIEEDISIIVIEHDMGLIEGLADRVICFSSGDKIAEGSFNEVSKDKEVIRAYLGEDE